MDICPVDHFQLQRRVHRRLTHREPIRLLDQPGNGLPDGAHLGTNDRNI